jgi:hypothetical protein
MLMPDALVVAIISAIVNGAVTWGVISTKLAWHRRDLDDHHERLKALEARPCILS